MSELGEALREYFYQKQKIEMIEEYNYCQPLSRRCCTEEVLQEEKDKLTELSAEVDRLWPKDLPKRLYGYLSAH